MYSGKFLSQISVNGSVLSERSDGVVEIPFGSEYCIRLENKHQTRAKASVYLDEEHVGDFVVEARSKLELKRFATENKAFLFVRPNSAKAKRDGKSDLSVGDNGVVRIHWYLEKAKAAKDYADYITKTPYIPDIPTKPWVNPTKNPWSQPWRTDDQYPSTPKIWMQNSGPKMSSFSGGVRGQSLNCSAPVEDGVTVKGNVTNQNFVKVYYEWQEDYVQHRLLLKGYDAIKETPTVEGENYCAECGRKRKKEKFCPACGHRFS